MIFLAPMPFKEALDSHDARSLLPTTGRTADLQKLDRTIKRRALFSATVAIAEPLQKIGDGVSAILSGSADQATVRLGIKQLWDKIGYKPDPEQAGGILDLTSDARIDLQIETNVAVARGAGWFVQGQQEAVLDEFPARELYDTAPGGKNRRDVHERWIKCGGKFIDGRMVALVNDPIWKKLGDPALFPDGLGNEFAPFWFSSKWRQRDIGRDEAIELGLIDANTELLPQSLNLDDTLQAAPEVRDAALRRDLEASGLGAFRGGTFIFTPNP